MNIEKAKPILLDISIPIRDEWDTFVVCYAGIELDGILYLMDPRDSSDYSEPDAYYQVDTKDIPNYDFSDDWNNMNTDHLLPPIYIDDKEIRKAVREACKTMKKQYKL